MRLLVIDQLPVTVVARKCGVHRSTVWRWKQKWNKLNKHVRLENVNRPSRLVSSPSGISSFRLAACRAVLAVREQLRRCAEVVWHYVTHTLGITVSLSSVRRILRRHHCFDGARKPRVKRDNPKRPLPTAPGELVQIDIIHHVDLYTGKRLYYYTVIDLWSRLSYAETHPVLAPRSSCGSCLEGRPNDNAYIERFNRTL